MQLFDFPQGMTGEQVDEYLSFLVAQDYETEMSNETRAERREQKRDKKRNHIPQDGKTSQRLSEEAKRSRARKIEQERKRKEQERDDASNSL